MTADLHAKIVGKFHNEKAILLLDTGAEVSVVDNAFARKVGSYIDSSQIQDCVEIGNNVYRTKEERGSRGSLWPKKLSSAWTIWFRPESAWISLTDPSACPTKSGSSLAEGASFTATRPGSTHPAESVELPLRLRTSDHENLWVTRGDHWVPTTVHGPGKIRYMRITNVGDKVLILHHDLRIGFWLAGDHVRDCQVSSQSGPGATWSGKIWFFEATVGPRSAGQDPDAEDPPRPAVERPKYETPRGILQRPRPTAIKCLKDGSNQPDTSDLDLTWDSDQDYDECVYYHESSDFYAVDVIGQLTVLPEVPITTEDVRIEDIRLCGSDNQTPEEIDRLL
ncbi:hypothetical protein PHMEG_00027478 [Phytophthora megakarya]|uniref:Peptidase A2 domain-containing protein n=1 Tax=Phytophthora megakarya TaxID=4795 RepID=A0A225V6U8_9STRA|nr:hypothetical protein PHMEG_00027478 [Phytophthora megakarya]